MAKSILTEGEKPDTNELSALKRAVEKFGTKAAIVALAGICATRGEELAESEPIMAAAWRQLADDLEAFANSRAGLR